MQGQVIYTIRILQQNKLLIELITLLIHILLALLYLTIIISWPYIRPFDLFTNFDQPLPYSIFILHFILHTSPLPLSHITKLVFDSRQPIRETYIFAIYKDKGIKELCRACRSLFMRKASLSILAISIEKFGLKGLVPNVKLGQLGSLV